MSHKEQKIFCKSVKKQFPHFFKRKTVIDVGSLDINGNNQYLFRRCRYMGIDIVAGKNVHTVCAAHQFFLEYSYWDVIISTEMLEHDQYYRESLSAMYRGLKDGGCFLLLRGEMIDRNTVQLPITHTTPPQQIITTRTYPMKCFRQFLHHTYSKHTSSTRISQTMTFNSMVLRLAGTFM